MERFQFAYGWLTQWNKTLAYLVGETQNQYGAKDLFAVDDLTAHFKELVDFIDNFSFLRFTMQAPLTLFHKIANQIMVSRCRALLSLQPVSQANAERLDSQIAVKIHEQTGMPYVFSSRILTLPVADHGLGVFSISRINTGIIADGLRRDLNHQDLLRGFSQYAGKIPSTRIIAQQVLAETKLSCRRTDQNFLQSGEVSLSHALKLCDHFLPPNFSRTNGNTLRTMKNKGVQLLRHMGLWEVSDTGKIKFRTNVAPFTRPYDRRWSIPQQANWNRIAYSLSAMEITWFFEGSLDLLLPHDERRQLAETRIKTLIQTSSFPPSGTNDTSRQQVWGTDGSMIPASATLTDARSVTAAATGPETLVLRVEGCIVFILHRELMGLIVTLILAEQKPRLYSDHQNSTQLIDDANSNVLQAAKLRHMNGRSYYCWILNLVKERRAMSHLDRIPMAPIPSFYMDEFTYYRDEANSGWIETNICTAVDFYMTRNTVNKLGTGGNLRMST
ncbi:hypothetical protein GGX14DRAFT_583181 [Mycena pura]|uniref:Uncharacterized protein n=1 Tax=Mycena pura TaxID=153505 RepID=A0AAD6YVL1_9AGAR|nr:hypothetical protein GGX14DRAFT_583181 [Mycena pura]